MDIILLVNLVNCGISTPEKFYEKKRKNITHGYHTYDWWGGFTFTCSY